MDSLIFVFNLPTLQQKKTSLIREFANCRQADIFFIITELVTGTLIFTDLTRCLKLSTILYNPKLWEVCFTVLSLWTLSDNKLCNVVYWRGPFGSPNGYLCWSCGMNWSPCCNTAICIHVFKEDASISLSISHLTAVGGHLVECLRDPPHCPLLMTGACPTVYEK